MRGRIWAFLVGVALTVESVCGFGRVSTTRKNFRPVGGTGRAGPGFTWTDTPAGFVHPHISLGTTTTTGRGQWGLRPGLPPSQFRLETDELLPITIGRTPGLDGMLANGMYRADLTKLGPLIPQSTGLSPDDEGFWARDLHSITSPSSPTAKVEDGLLDRQNFTANVGKALDVLRLDVPLCFEKEPDLSIYTEDVRFRDQLRVYSTGKFMYQMLFFSLRLARVFMPIPPIVEVLNMRWCEARQAIYVRFQIRIDTLSDQLYYDAVSLYRVNAKGFIYEHIIENVIRNDLMERPSVVAMMVETVRQALGPPTPAVPENGVGC